MSKLKSAAQTGRKLDRMGQTGKGSANKHKKWTGGGRIGRQTGRRTGRQRARKKNRKTDRMEKNRQTDRQGTGMQKSIKVDKMGQTSKGWANKHKHGQDGAE